jgi:hypothetical protein
MSSGYDGARPVIGSDSLSQTLVAYEFKDNLTAPPATRHHFYFPEAGTKSAGMKICAGFLPKSC